MTDSDIVIANNEEANGINVWEHHTLKTVISRRVALRIGGMAGIGALTLGAGPCSVSKDKAVRYSSLAINYLKDIRPLAAQLGGTVVVEFVDKAIPALEKVKDALEKSDSPSAGNLFNTVTGILGQLATALLQLPESARRDTIIGILTLVNVTLRTVSLFVEAEMPSTADVPMAVKAAADESALMKAFQATRF